MVIKNQENKMSKLVPNVELKKADGKPIKFNFQFENGLPMKPLHNVPYEIWSSESLNGYGITVTLKSLLEIKDLTLSVVSYHNTKNSKLKDIWIHLAECYIVIKDVEKPLVEKMQAKGFGVVFLDENGQQLNKKM